jgi:hypothetical protein
MSARLPVANGSQKPFVGLAYPKETTMLSLLASTFALPLVESAAQAAPHHEQSPVHKALLTIENRSGSRVTVYVDRDYVGSVGKWDRETFAVQPGHGDVVVRDAEGHTVAKASEWFVAGRADVVVAAMPKTGLVHVANRTPMRGELFVDGVRKLSLDPREDLEIRLSTGEHRAQFKIGGHLVMTKEIHVDAWDERNVIVDVALEGNLVVRNPLPIAVVLSTPKSGYDRRVEPYGTAYFQDLTVGSVAIEVSRANGDQIAMLRPQIRPFDTTRVEVPMPKVGALEIRAEDYRTMVVTIDDRAARQFEHIVKLDVATGRHRIDVRSSNGRMVLSKVVEIDPFDVTRVRVEDRTPDALSYWDRNDRHGNSDRDDDRGEHSAYTDSRR